MLFGGHLLLERFGGLFGFGLAGLEQGAPDRVDALEKCGYLYQLVLCYESADWGQMTHYAELLGLPMNIITQIYFDSVFEQDKFLLWLKKNSHLQKDNRHIPCIPWLLINYRSFFVKCKGFMQKK